MAQAVQTPPRGLKLAELGIDELSEGILPQQCQKLRESYGKEFGRPDSFANRLTGLLELSQYLAQKAKANIEKSSSDDVKELKSAIADAFNVLSGENVFSKRRLNGWKASDILALSTPELRNLALTSLRSHLIKTCGVKSNDIMSAILRNPELRELVKGPNGYRLTATLVYGGNMATAYQRVSALCKENELEFKELGWPNAFKGNASQYRDEIKWLKQNFSVLTSATPKVKDRYTSLPTKLKGPWGYIAFAEAKYGGDMIKAFKNMSALCDAAGLEFKELGWPNAFHGNTSQYRNDIKWLKQNFSALTSAAPEVKDKYTSLPTKLKGPWGYIAYAEAKHGGDMIKASINMSALCEAAGLEFKELGWPNQFQGNASQYRDEIKSLEKNFSALTSAAPEVKDKYTSLPTKLKGLWGYIAYAEAKYGGNMLKAFINMSALCDAAGLEFKELGWPNQFHGNASQYRDEIKSLEKNFSALTSGAPEVQDKYTSLPTKLKGPWGYIAYAEAKYGGDMQKAFMNMSALCDAAGLEFKELGWPNQFQGNASQYRDEIKWLEENFSVLTSATPEVKDKYTSLPTQLKGPWGYIAYAEARYGGDMGKAFKNMSALCEAAGLELKELGWPNAFYGNANQYRDEIKWLKQNFSVLTSAAPEVKDKYTSLPTKLKGPWGYIAYAEAKHGGDMQKASMNMSALCDAAGLEFKELSWPNQFQGNASQYRDEIKWLEENFSVLTSATPEVKDKYTSLPTKLKGPWGYIAFAEAKYGGNMQKAFMNMSALCDAAGLEFKELGWPNAFQGNANQYRDEIKWLEENFSVLTSATPEVKDKYTSLPTKLKGRWGYIAYAEAKYGGDMLKAFMNMSALCDAAGLEFKELGWPNQFQGNASQYRSQITQ